MKRKQFMALLLSCAMVVSLLVGCQGKSAQESADDESQGGDSSVSGEITFVTQLPEYSGVVEKFESDYPNIKLNWEQQSGDNVDTIQKTRLAAGAEGIDILTPSKANYPVMAEAGQLLDITGDELLDNYGESVVDSAEVDGSVYGIPMTRQTYLVWYNKDMFDECGVSEPTTMDEFMEVCEKLKSNDITPIVTYGKGSGMVAPTAIFFNSLLSEDTDWINKVNSGEAKWTDEAPVAAFTKFKEAVEKGYYLEGSLSLDDTQAFQAFYQGKAAMLPNGAWSIDKMASTPPEFEVGAFAYVSDEGVENKAAATYGTTIAIAAESKNKDAALTFLRWLSQPENAQLYCDESMSFVTVDGVSSEFAPEAALLDPIFSMDTTPMLHAYMTPAAKEGLAVALQQLLAFDETGVTPEEAAQSVQAEQDKDIAE